MTEENDRPVALVLGAAVWPGGVPSPVLARRARAGAALWLTGRVRAVVGCGGVGVHGPSEAAVIAQLCAEAGVPEAALRLEDRSTNTRENLAFARPVLEELAASHVLVVSDGWHLPRALLLARRQGIAAKGAPVPLKGARPGPQLKGALREVPAFVWTWASGEGR